MDNLKKLENSKNSDCFKGGDDNFCYDLAIINADTSYCKYIKEKDKKSACIQRIAILKKNEDLCKGIDFDADALKKCVKEVKESIYFYEEMEKINKKYDSK